MLMQRPAEYVTHIPSPKVQLLTWAEQRLLWAIGGVSIFTNLLMLTGPLFMLQVYDRVLSSRSEPTLVVLFALVGFLYLILGTLDHARARIAARLGAQIQDRLDRPVFLAALQARSGRTQNISAARAPADLTTLQQFSGAPVFMALFDFPWVPLLLGIIAMLHPWLGALALASAAILTGLGVANMSASHGLVATSHARSLGADRLGRQIAQQAGLLRATGMQEAAIDRWQAHRRGALNAALGVNDNAGRFGASARTLRLFLQSTMLATGAWLVLQGQLSAGGMIAASIILGRALAPLDQLVGGWPQVQAALGALGRVRQMLVMMPKAPAQMQLPAPSGRLAVRRLGLRVPDITAGARLVLRDISFELFPGQALGVIGPSGAGKSSLVEVIVGLQDPSCGDVRLDGARLDQYPNAQFARAIGYLPQQVSLFDGSLRDNISRLDPDARDEDVVAAAKAANAHALILSLPDGYQTRVDTRGGGLSGGQVKRIALARALFRDPVLLVLDEPDASLDDDGLRALHATITVATARGAAVLVTAHRVSALGACDQVMKLDRGTIASLGPVDKILQASQRPCARSSRPEGQGQRLAAPPLAWSVMHFPWDTRVAPRGR